MHELLIQRQIDAPVLTILDGPNVRIKVQIEGFVKPGVELQSHIEQLSTMAGRSITLYQIADELADPGDAIYLDGSLIRSTIGS